MDNFQGVLAVMAWARSFAVGDRVAIRRPKHYPKPKGEIVAIRSVAEVTSYGKVILDDGAPFIMVGDGVAEMSFPKPPPSLAEAPWQRNYVYFGLLITLANEQDEVDDHERELRKELPALLKSVGYHSMHDIRTKHLSVLELEEVTAALKRVDEVINAAWVKGRPKGVHRCTR